MKNDHATYSKIIDPKTYCELMNQHRYIREADRRIEKMIEMQVYEAEKEVVELGCGPGRLTYGMKKYAVHLTAVDHDPEFLDYGRETLRLCERTNSFVFGLEFAVNLVCADATTYRHPRPVTVFYSQGMHHHIPKGRATRQYLQNVYSQLTPGGRYIVSDEFLAPYNNDEERRKVMVMWYSHIIVDALANNHDLFSREVAKKNHNLLADEEAKTLLDDLSEASDPEWVKTPEQIELIHGRVTAIDRQAMLGDLHGAYELADKFLRELARLRTTQLSGDPRFDLSRGDYKVCASEFRSEASGAGFIVESVQHLGPIDICGGFSIYVLRKPG